jgi:DNA processing protein
MRDPAYQTREGIAAARAGRGFEAAAQGLWCCGDLGGLGRTCVAIVGTRAATPYGRRLAQGIAAELGRAGCCVVSGLALGVDAAAHEGALSVGAPTIGVLGSGHRHFFPRRNAALAERMLAGGGAVLSPYAPDQPAFRGQFLERNGIVAALADAVLVIEAPARSGALNTAGWAAGRIPVLAVPGDVDRRHVQGCLALIRDGATLARDAGDVLEALGHARPLPAAIATLARDATSTALLRAMEAGATEFDAIVAASGVSASAALASLALLELEGEVESRGAACYMKVERRISQ